MPIPRASQALCRFRAQLIREIQTLPEDDLQPRAMAILKAKNRLSAEEAKLVEEAFAARMALQGASSEALATEEPVSAPIDPSPPQPPLASTVPVKLPKGAPQKGQGPDRRNRSITDRVGVSHHR